MQIHQLLYSVSEAVSFSAASGITGGDLSAVARFWREVVRMQVESAEGTVSEDHRQLLKVCIALFACGISLYGNFIPRTPLSSLNKTSDKSNDTFTYIHVHIHPLSSLNNN